MLDVKGVVKMLLSNGGVEEVDEENDIVVGTNGSVYVKGRVGIASSSRPYTRSRS